MKLLTGLNMLFAIWLLLWACPAGGDTSTVNIMDQSIDDSSSFDQFTYAALNTTVTDINNASFVAGVTSVSSTRCRDETVSATMPTVLPRQPKFGDLTSFVKLPRGFCHSQNSTSLSFLDPLLDVKTALKLLNASDASMADIPHPSGSEDSEMKAVDEDAKNTLSASSMDSQNIQGLPRYDNLPVALESQVQSMPTLIPEPTAMAPHPASRTSAPIIPRAEEVTPAPATHKSLIIGVVFGSFFGLLMIVCVAAACCTATVRRKTWFWRRPEDRVRNGLPRYDSPATTLGLSSGGISNASSDTLFEAYGIRPGQYPRNVRLSGRTTQRGQRDSGSYELQNLRALAGYSTGGYLSAV